MTKRRRSPAAFRFAVIAAVVLTGFVTLIVYTRPPWEITASPAAMPVSLTDRLPATGQSGDAGPGGNPQFHTLVLYDAGERDPDNPAATPAEAGQSEAYAMYTANLVSRAGAWKIRAAADYQPGEINGYQAVVYVGAISEALLPPALLSDVDTAHVPVIWLGENVQKLFEHDPGLAARLGWQPAGRSSGAPESVLYKETPLTRDKRNEGIPVAQVTDPRNATVLADAVLPDGAKLPWAVRSGGFTYLTEAPYSFVDEGDRYLALTDILLGTLAPNTTERHRALVRIEDIGPRTDPQQVRQITDYLYSQNVPFSLAVYPYYADPNGAANGGRPTFARLVDSPALADSLRYAIAHGGTLLMHGYSHQYEEANNPYDASSGADYEFYSAYVDDDNAVVETGPVPADSVEWFRNRIATGLGEFRRVGLPEPSIFEFPHYGGSALDYKEVTSIFAARYDQGSYYAGYCPRGACGSTGTASYETVNGQYFPYPVRDVYGAVVVPENLDHIAPTAYNQHPARLPANVLADAGRQLVVRDNVASFFFHPFLPVTDLAAVVNGLRTLGYQFTAASDLART